MTNTMFETPTIQKSNNSVTLAEHMKAVTSGGTYKEMALENELKARQYEEPEVIAHIVRTLG